MCIGFLIDLSFYYEMLLEFSSVQIKIVKEVIGIGMALNRNHNLICRNFACRIMMILKAYQTINKQQWCWCTVKS